MPQIKPYFEQLLALADGDADKLRGAFTQAGFSTSYFYRARNGADMHLNTAKAVAAQMGATLPEAAA